ncbi:cysteine-rich CWC family protein [Thaumasiovibrio sp. DFM-14]|uniref:cysteine-rich CWC family protein n=1 Tax=Thaumasiovibrio sp. DFM-14 TaxID=3384792 RepID=UPI0039A33C28
MLIIENTWNPMNAKLDPTACPLCGESNVCANHASSGKTTSCWCKDPSLTFSQPLFLDIPLELKGKACVCKSCVLKYQAGKDVRQ